MEIVQAYATKKPMLSGGCTADPAQHHAAQHRMPAT